MKMVAAITIIILATSFPATAENCHEKFVRLTNIGNGETPAKLHITTEMKNGNVSENEFWFISSDHYMTIVPGKPPQWVLGYDNTLFFSLDEGKKWQTLRKMDTQQNKANTAKDQAENAETVKNAVCGKAELDGVLYDTVEADIRILQNINADYHNKYWITRKTGLAYKVVYDSTANENGTITTQIIKYTPDLELPMPQ